MDGSWSWTPVRAAPSSIPIELDVQESDVQESETNGTDNAWHATCKDRILVNACTEHGNSATDPIDTRKLAQDWITVWQSELSAMAVDREIQKTWRNLIALWADTVSTMLHSIARYPDVPCHDSPCGRPRSDDAPRTAPATPAPDARDIEIERLARHVAALEGRLANLERDSDPAMHGKKRPRGKPGK